MVGLPEQLTATEKGGGMARDVTLTCSNCGAEQTAPGTSKKWKGWRVLLDDETRALLGYRCPACHKAHEARGAA